MNITKLQTRFFICYLLAVLIPILILSCIIYYYNNSQRMKEYMNERENSLIIEQNYLKTQLNQSRNYFNQLKSNYELKRLLRGFYLSEREIVYIYNSQIYSLLSGIALYDENLSDMDIYVRREEVSHILRYFEPMSSFSIPAEYLPGLYDGFWLADTGAAPSGFSFYIGIPDPPDTFPGILALHYNSRIFDTYADSNSDSSVYIYLNEKLLFSYNDMPESAQCLEDYGFSFLENDHEEPFALPDKSGRFLISAIKLDSGTFHVVKITPIEGSLFSYQPFLISLLLSFLVLIIASAILFLLIFQPLTNVVRLSEHMNGQNKHTLTPYTGKISKDEIGDLILSFNRMTERINELSDDLLRNEMQLKNAQLEALQAQLNPHFFYGTLESIRMIAEANHQELISEIAFSFGNLMRYSLSREYLVPVSREIDMTRQYLSIQEKRLANRFNVDWLVCELDKRWRCPKFILFSMVENVFSHNVSKCRQFVHISILFEQDGDDLTITVSNTGPGIPAERLALLRRLLTHPEERGSMTSENNGRSIFNINDRLKLFYGNKYRFSIESTENELTICKVKIHKHFIDFL